MQLKKDLQAIFAEAQHLLDSTINAQQRAFIVYIANITRQLQNQISHIPENEDAYTQVIPTLSETFVQPQTVICGYSRMLIDHPGQFQAPPMRADQAQRLENIYALGLRLAQEIERYTQKAEQERLAGRQTEAQALGLDELLGLEEPLWRYWLRTRPLSLQVVRQLAECRVSAHPYHLRQLLRHIVLTIGQELIEGGQLRLDIEEDGRWIMLGFSAHHLPWTTDQLATVFMRQGRDVYTAYLSRYGGSWGIVQAGTPQARLNISLPRA